MIAQSLCAAVAVTSGVLLYSYPQTLAAVRQPLVYLHDLSGDLLILAVIVYLLVHLRRTLKLWALALSWWTGLLSVAALVVVGLTGVYGQLWPMPSGEVVWVVHVAGGLLVTASACSHSAYGLRRRIR